MEKKKTKILVPIDDTKKSKTSRSVINYISNLSALNHQWHICLVHIFRIPSASEELMGKKFTSEQYSKILAMLENARENLIRNGFAPESVDLKIAKTKYSSVSDGIIDQYQKQSCDMIIIGRRKMSKAEEFVMGDISIKLIRMLEKASVLVVTI